MKLTSESLAQEAIGTLALWLPGYTDPDEDTGLQHKIVRADSNSEYVDVRVCESDGVGWYDPDGPVYRIKVIVEEVDRNDWPDEDVRKNAP